MRKSRGNSTTQAAPHDIENPNPNLCMQLGAWMMEELELDKPSPTYPLRCIFRVPHRLRCARENAYTPQIISIGPLHHENPALKAMEEHKKQYLQYFMGRTKHLNLMHYIKKIKDQEARLRSCYSETICPDSDKFVKIILVDAIFIIEFLFRNWYPELLDENDCIFGKPGMREDIWPDLLMLENQLPFFILVDLFDPNIFPIPSEYSDRLKGVERLSILFLSLYFSNGVPTFGGRSDDLKTLCSSEVKHFVDLLRKLCIAPMLKEQYQGQLKHTTESLAGVEQQSGHMIADELVRVNVHDEVGGKVYELVRPHESLGSPLSLGADELEGDISEDDLGGANAAAPLGTNELERPHVTLLAAAPLGTNEFSGGNVYELVRPHESLGSDELEGDISEDDLDGANVGAAAPLGTDELEGAHVTILAAAPLGTNEFSDSDWSVGAAAPLVCRIHYSILKRKACCCMIAEQSKYTTAPSIEELHLAGVKFEDQSTNNLFDIRFEHGILKIPKLKTEDRTELILRNLVAFEQCAFITQKINKNESAFEECYISDYVGIMDQFVDTSKDVELLVKYKIVENILGGGNDALSTMINSVSTGVICLRKNTSLAYVTICEDLNEFCSSNWNKSKANLRQNYFNTPWAIISFCAAVFLLILTVVQTICSIISLS